MKKLFVAVLLCLGFAASQAQTTPLYNEPVDISPDFRNFTNIYFLADSLSAFNPQTGQGKIEYKRSIYKTRNAFDNTLAVLRHFRTVEFPDDVYPVNPSLPFSIEFVSPRVVRIRTVTAPAAKPNRETSLMLVKEPAKDNSWKYTKVKGGHKYSSEFGSVVISESPWRIAFYDAAGKLLTQSRHELDNNKTFHPNVPFAFVRRASDYTRSVNASFDLSPGEKIFGCGESFSRLDKRGQKVVLYVDDANGVENNTMYKPIPFFMSSRGYGMFMHTSTPVTCDFGADFYEAMNLMIGDDELDLFVMLGNPKEVLNEYTELTGKSPMPPLWSFGLWMSRISYFSQKEGYDVAANIRKYKIPTDVIHFDTGWFEYDWQCDYEFSKTRFADPAKMIKDLKKDGFNICLWQIPYFVPKNRYFNEVVDKRMCVTDAKGNPTHEDAILDFSNPTTIKWYQEKLAGLLKMGVGAIKVDFGEAGPMNGNYASGRNGFYEHNLYPLRYNKTVGDITKQTNNEQIMWARSAWAGSQRYPIHWGGDASNTNGAMLYTLRGGLSLGLSGFSFWSHDIGGFVEKTPEDLYRRWLPFGMMTSHSRAHGTPPKEPWLYNESFTDAFRLASELKYKLMPYVYAQSKESSEKGLPMVRALFVEFPEDPGAWNVEDQYLFGADIMVAPIFEDKGKERVVYLPKGRWIDYQSGKVYEKGFQTIQTGVIPAVILVREGAVIPHIKLAQSTKDMDWSNIDLKVYGQNISEAKGLFCLPADNKLQPVSLTKSGSNWVVKSAVAGVKFNVK